MEIEEAFMKGAIEDAGTNVEGEDEARLRAMITQLYASNEIEYSENHIDIGVILWVSGRAFQADLTDPLIPIPMTPDEIREYIAYLVQKGEA